MMDSEINVTNSGTSSKNPSDPSNSTQMSFEDRLNLSFEEQDLTENMPLCDQELTEQITSIPEKLAFKIGEVAEMVGVKQYVLRYWETEFDVLRPKKSRSGQRVYSRRDVETVMMIKKLLYDHRFSIEGARSALKNMKDEVRKERSWKSVIDRFDHARNQVVDLCNDIRRVKKLFE